MIYGEEHPRHGTCVRFDGNTLAFVNYYHDERVAYHQVIRIEDMDEAPSTTFINHE